MVEPIEKLLSAGVAVAESGGEIFDGRSQRFTLCLERLEQVATHLLSALLFAKGDAGLGRLRIEAAFGLHVVQSDVAPATRVEINRFEEHSPSD